MAAIPSPLAFVVGRMLEGSQVSTDLYDLFNSPTYEDIFNYILNLLATNGYPITDWSPGGVELSRVSAFATTLHYYLTTNLPVIAAGGFVDYAQGAWLRLLAKQRYDIDYHQATNTEGIITFTSSANAGTNSVSSGALIIQFPGSGNRYINIDDVVLTPGTSADVLMRSEYPGSVYKDPSDTVVDMVSVYPGVSARSAQKLFNTGNIYSTRGLGDGYITLSGVPNASISLQVIITQSGEVGTGKMKYTLNGVGYSEITIPSSITFNGLNVSFHNNHPASFFVGDTYQIMSPIGWITQVGTDDESDTDLANRCRNRWALLSNIPTTGWYDTTVRQASNQIVEVLVNKNKNVQGRVDVVIAGSGGSILPSDVITKAQQYLLARVPITDDCLVVSPSRINIAITGIVEVLAGVDVLSSVKAALNNYLSNLGVNANASKGYVRISEIVKVICGVSGVIDTTNIKINGVASNLRIGGTDPDIYQSVDSIDLSGLVVA